MKGKNLGPIVIAVAIIGIALSIMAGQFPYLGIVALITGIISVTCTHIVKVTGDHFTDYYFKMGKINRLFLQKADKGYRW